MSHLKDTNEATWPKLVRKMGMSDRQKWIAHVLSLAGKNGSKQFAEKRIHYEAARPHVIDILEAAHKHLTHLNGGEHFVLDGCSGDLLDMGNAFKELVLAVAAHINKYVEPSLLERLVRLMGFAGLKTEPPAESQTISPALPSGTSQPASDHRTTTSTPRPRTRGSVSSLPLATTASTPVKNTVSDSGATRPRSPSIEILDSPPPSAASKHSKPKRPLAKTHVVVKRERSPSIEFVSESLKTGASEKLDPPVKTESTDAEIRQENQAKMPLHHVERRPTVQPPSQPFANGDSGLSSPLSDISTNGSELLPSTKKPHDTSERPTKPRNEDGPSEFVIHLAEGGSRAVPLTTNSKNGARSDLRPNIVSPMLQATSTEVSMDKSDPVAGNEERPSSATETNVANTAQQPSVTTDSQTPVVAAKAVSSVATSPDRMDVDLLSLTSVQSDLPISQPANQTAHILPGSGGDRSQLNGLQLQQEPEPELSISTTEKFSDVQKEATPQTQDVEMSALGEDKTVDTVLSPRSPYEAQSAESGQTNPSLSLKENIDAPTARSTLEKTTPTGRFTPATTPPGRNVSLEPRPNPAVVASSVNEHSVPQFGNGVVLNGALQGDALPHDTSALAVKATKQQLQKLLPSESLVAEVPMLSPNVVSSPRQLTSPQPPRTPMAQSATDRPSAGYAIGSLAAMTPTPMLLTQDAQRHWMAQQQQGTIHSTTTSRLHNSITTTSVASSQPVVPPRWSAPSAPPSATSPSTIAPSSSAQTVRPPAAPSHQRSVTAPAKPIPLSPETKTTPAKAKTRPKKLADLMSIDLAEWRQRQTPSTPTPPTTPMTAAFGAPQSPSANPLTHKRPPLESRTSLPAVPIVQNPIQGTVIEGLASFTVLSANPGSTAHQGPPKASPASRRPSLGLHTTSSGTLKAQSLSQNNGTNNQQTKSDKKTTKLLSAGLSESSPHSISVGSSSLPPVTPIVPMSQGPLPVPAAPKGASIGLTMMTPLTPTVPNLPRGKDDVPSIEPLHAASASEPDVTRSTPASAHRSSTMDRNGQVSGVSNSVQSGEPPLRTAGTAVTTQLNTNKSSTVPKPPSFPVLKRISSGSLANAAHPVNGTHTWESSGLASEALRSAEEELNTSTERPTLTTPLSRKRAHEPEEDTLSSTAMKRARNVPIVQMEASPVPRTSRVAGSTISPPPTLPPRLTIPPPPVPLLVAPVTGVLQTSALESTQIARASSVEMHSPSPPPSTILTTIPTPPVLPVPHELRPAQSTSETMMEDVPEKPSVSKPKYVSSQIIKAMCGLPRAGTMSFKVAVTNDEYTRLKKWVRRWEAPEDVEDALCISIEAYTRNGEADCINEHLPITWPVDRKLQIKISKPDCENAVGVKLDPPFNVAPEDRVDLTHYFCSGLNTVSISHIGSCADVYLVLRAHAPTPAQRAPIKYKMELDAKMAEFTEAIKVLQDTSESAKR